MRKASVALAAVALALSADTGSAARERITVNNFGVKFRVDRWDDGRNKPYQISFRKRGIFSKYVFDASGGLIFITVDDAKFEIGQTAKALDATGPRMLVSVQAEKNDGDTPFNHHQRRLHDCSNCEQTWDTLCGVGLEAVCDLSDKKNFFPAGNPRTTVARMCNKFGKECQASAEETCADICTETAADDCDLNPCENGGSCSADPAGGHVCSCASGYGGMACQIDTSSLDAFYIELDFVGTWTDARKAVFQFAAGRWSEIITHVPCGGNFANPAGRLLIRSTLEEIDGLRGVLGSAGPSSIWNSCPTVSLLGAMKFDIADIEDLEHQGTLEGVILHEMGHVIGVGTLWGSGFGECTTCRADGDPAWKCPAALSAYADVGGSGAEIVELDGATGTTCAHLDEDIFDDELMTGYVDQKMFLSKMTAAILDDLDYIVDPSAVDTYTLPSKRGASISTESVPSIAINDTAVDSIILALDDDGNVIEKKMGVMMEF